MHVGVVKKNCFEFPWGLCLLTATLEYDRLTGQAFSVVIRQHWHSRCLRIKLDSPGEGILAKLVLSNLWIWKFDVLLAGPASFAVKMRLYRWGTRCHRCCLRHLLTHHHLRMQSSYWIIGQLGFSTKGSGGSYDPKKPVIPKPG